MIALSGGRDSMLLLRLFEFLWRENFLSQEPVVFHLHHGLREAADQELELVAQETRRAGFALYYERRNAADYARRGGLSLEEAGRVLRYRLAARLMKKLGPARLVTGHHADDYLESLLLHLIRGGGPSALATLKIFERVEGLEIFRPMVVLNRAEIDAAVQLYNISYLEDDSNSSREFRRNRLRQDVMPVLIREGMDSWKTWRNFHPAPEDDVFLAGPESALDRMALDRSFFQGGTPRDLKVLLDLTFRRMGAAPLERGLLNEISRQIRASSSDRIHCESGEILLWSAVSGPVWILRKDSSLWNRFRARLLEPEGDRRFQVRFGGIEKVYELTPTQEFRSFEPGMQYVSGGSKQNPGGHKKLKKLFQELHLPPPVRKNLPLIYDREERIVQRICLSFWQDLKDR